MKEKKKVNSKVSAGKELTKSGHSKAAKERMAKLKPVKFMSEEDESGICKIIPQETDLELLSAKMKQALGTSDQNLQFSLLQQLVGTLNVGNTGEDFDPNTLVNSYDNVMALLQGIAPKDEIESMLSLQMIGTHNLAMTVMARATNPDQTFKWAQVCMNYSIKLLRTFTAQMEALKKYRSKGEQKMTVEHVHVNEGGQAIVGNVKTTGGEEKK